MSPETDLSDLGRKLQQKKDDAEYRRFREIQQFSHRFRFAGLIMTFFFLILGFVFYMLNMQTGIPLFAYLTLASVGLGWLYLLALPVLFVIRTTLLAYVLEKHWVWLSMVIGLPVDIYFLPAPGQGGAVGILGRIPIVFFAFLLWGFIRRKPRREVFQKEARKHDDLWSRLIPLGVLDIALFGFWNIRPVKPEESPPPAA